MHNFFFKPGGLVFRFSVFIAMGCAQGYGAFKSCGLALFCGMAIRGADEYELPRTKSVEKKHTQVAILEGLNFA